MPASKSITAWRPTTLPAALRLAAWLLVLVGGSAAGQEKPAGDRSWVGKSVFLKDDAQPRNGDQLVDRGVLTFPAIVGDVDGDRLWLGRGWVTTSEVMEVDEALDYFSDQIRRNPKNTYARHSRATVWKAKGDLDAALKDFTAVIRLEPKDARAFSARGFTWHAKGERDEALADFTEAVRLDPNLVSAYNGRGYVWYMKGDLDAAIKDYSEAVRIDPQFTAGFNNRGIAWKDKGDFDAADKDYAEAIRLDPKYVKAHNNRGVLRLDRDDFDGAIQDFTRTLELDPRYAFAYDNRGVAHRCKGDFEAALRDHDEAIRLDPKFAPAYHHRGWLRATAADAKFRDGAAAVKDAEHACELSDWKDADCINTLAAAHAEAGDFKQADEIQRKAIRGYKYASEKAAGRRRLMLYRDKQPYREKIDAKK